MNKTSLIIGTLDTKASEFALLREAIEKRGVRTLMMDVGVMHDDAPRVDCTAASVAEAAGTTLDELRSRGDRGYAMQVMGEGAAKLAGQMHRRGEIDAVIGMGGTGGTSVACSVMRTLPLGMPKMCVTTVAGGDSTTLVGGRDILLVPSIVDVSGLNCISEPVITRAAAMLCAMLEIDIQSAARTGRVIAASMFGNTTKCIDACRSHFEAEGCEVLVFHATGTGGQTMESLIEQGMVDGVLDLTTTELADELCGGIFSAGPTRLATAARRGIPQVVAPGCLDMVNFGPMSTVPPRYLDANRQLYEWNSATTLMRTNVEENRQLGRTLAERVNDSTGPAAVLLPLRGVSILDGDGERFCDRESDAACFAAIKENLRGDIPVVEADANINDNVFSQKAIALLEEMFDSRVGRQGVAAV